MKLPAVEARVWPPEWAEKVAGGKPDHGTTRQYRADERSSFSAGIESVVLVAEITISDNASAQNHPFLQESSAARWRLRGEKALLDGKDSRNVGEWVGGMSGEHAIPAPPFRGCVRLEAWFDSYGVEAEQAEPKDQETGLTSSIWRVMQNAFGSRPFQSSVHAVFVARKDLQVSDALKGLAKIACERIRERAEMTSATNLNTHDATYVLPISFSATTGLPMSPVTLTWCFEDIFDQGWEDSAPIISQRRAFFCKFGIPLFVPLLQEKQCLTNISLASQDVLRSPHALLVSSKSHSLTGGFEASIFGDFDFFHYKSMNEDDQGWGCAYRSTQMLCSWLVLNGFLEGFHHENDNKRSTAPSIASIQHSLCEMGVMDETFSPGCKQWIGSQEISWLISTLTTGKIECRFLFVKGRDAGSLARDLQEHFDETGCPVVCCGGNLALTMLGVASDPLNGGNQSTHFLIADPHYTGPDVYEDIVDRSGQLEGGFRAAAVSWRKAPQCFLQDADYTLVLPHRSMSPN